MEKNLFTIPILGYTKQMTEVGNGIHLTFMRELTSMDGIVVLLRMGPLSK